MTNQKEKEIPKKRPNPAKMSPEVLERYHDHLRKVAAKRGGN